MAVSIKVGRRILTPHISIFREQNFTYVADNRIEKGDIILIETGWNFLAFLVECLDQVAPKESLFVEEIDLIIKTIVDTAVGGVSRNRMEIFSRCW